MVARWCCARNAVSVYCIEPTIVLTVVQGILDLADPVWQALWIVLSVGCYAWGLLFSRNMSFEEMANLLRELEDAEMEERKDDE